MNSPGFQRVTLIPMKTTLFCSEKLSHWKAAILEKGLMLEIKLRPLFQGLVCPKYSEVEAKDPRLWYWTIFTQSIKCMGLKSLFKFRKIWGHTLYDKQLGAWISHYLVRCTPTCKCGESMIQISDMAYCFLAGAFEITQRGSCVECKILTTTWSVLRS